MKTTHDGVEVNLLERLAIDFRVRLAARRARKRAEARGDTLAPPLNIAFRTKKMVAMHYLRGRRANRSHKVAWVTSGAPIEFLKALDFYILYPENHGALCGTARVVVDIASEAENAGYSRDICSYARTDIGAMVSGKTPVGQLPRPDLLVACTNICQTVLHWYRVVAHHFDVPLVLIDTPFIYTELTDHAIAFVKRQLEEAILIIESVAGRPLDPRRFETVTTLSRDATDLWGQILARSKNRPAPISVFDQFIHMAPIVEMRGESATVDFYAAMLKEIDQRIDQGIGAVKDERKRLLWDNLPIWYRLRYLAEYLGRHGIVIAASTYTNAWAELMPLTDPTQPLESMARTYLSPLLNRGTGDKLATMKRMIADYSLDGTILHSDRSCKPYSIGQMDQRDRLIQESGTPALLLEADHNDPRSFSEEQVANRLAAFVEMLEV
ncbi:MAG TPA: 2-hydroxyacyl-CoA dehydratase family protein [Anaerolineae bacterium]|jgi:benzoyl-CoA reductase/2-hydroxyglutaryl-CoA dehydratase subunit BcrC/BadD/HgdB|nr:2-hydroxyacyl-CoA dehydratase family protein [Anaerolineae bacterium]